MRRCNTSNDLVMAPPRPTTTSNTSNDFIYVPLKHVDPPEILKVYTRDIVKVYRYDNTDSVHPSALIYIWNNQVSFHTDKLVTKWHGNVRFEGRRMIIKFCWYGNEKELGEAWLDPSEDRQKTGYDYRLYTGYDYGQRFIIMTELHKCRWCTPCHCWHYM